MKVRKKWDLLILNSKGYEDFRMLNSRNLYNFVECKRYNLLLASRKTEKKRNSL